MMKRTYIKVTLLRTLLLFTVVVSFANLHVQAQDAFYVYRNDGDFNGFFFDQVVRMECTKVDLQGVAHEDYVIQEIETLDSLYRIPIAAIDSIGFQQPEIKLNPNLKDMEEEGLHEYILSVSNRLIYNGDGTSRHQRQINLNKNLPASLLPKVGDVLVDFNEDFISAKTGENSFSGKVSEVELFQNEYFMVMLEPLTDLGDVFVQFITTEQITIDKHGNARHRLAGWSQNKRRAYSAENESASLIDIDGTFKRTFSPKEHVDITMECGVELGVKMQVSYNISWKRLFVKTDLLTHAAAKPAVSVEANAPFEGTIDVMDDLGKIMFPINFPIFQTHPLPQIDLKGNGSAALKVSFPQIQFDWNPSVIFDTDAGKMMSFNMSQNQSNEKPESSPIDPGDIEMSLSGSLQAGVKFSANIETNSWIEDIFSSGIELSLLVGPKIEGNMSLSIKNAAEAGNYGALQLSRLKFHPLSADLEASAELKFLWRDKEKTTFFDSSKQWGTIEWFLVPQYEDVNVQYVKKYREVSYESKITRNTFMMSTPFVGLYDINGDLVDIYRSIRSVPLKNEGTELKTTFKTENLRAGHFTVKSGFRIAGVDVVADQKWIDVPPYIQHETTGVDSLTVSSEKQDLRELFLTNTPHVDSFPFYYQGNENDWITASISDIQADDEAGYLNLTIDANDGIFSRYADVGIGTNKLLPADTIRIIQKPKYDSFKYARIKAIDKYGNTFYASNTFSNLSCSREGDVFTLSATEITRSSSEGDTFERRFNLVVDATDKKKPYLKGELSWQTHNQVANNSSGTLTFEGFAKPVYKFTKGDAGYKYYWGDYDIIAGYDMSNVNTNLTYQVSYTGTGLAPYLQTEKGQIDYVEIELCY